jgi:hypothetical protein
MGRAAHAPARDRVDAGEMNHPELLAAFCAAIAIELAHLRWVVLKKWHCRSCGDPHLHCECKPAWVKLLL